MAPSGTMDSASDFIRHHISDDDTRLLDRDLRIVGRELSSSNVTGSPQLLISVTCVIGGSIVLLLLVYAIRRRAAAAAYATQSQPSHGGPVKSKQSRKEDITALPMYRQECSMDTLAHVTSHNSRSDAKESPGAQNWREKTAEKQIVSIQTKAVEEVEPAAKVRASSKLTEPEPAFTPHPQARDPAPRHPRQSPKDKDKSIPVVAERGIASARIKHDLESKLGHGLDAGVDDNRWSWTNSQAPTTPRVRAFSMRFSNSSLASLPPLPMPIAQTSMAIRDGLQEARHVDVSQPADNASASQVVEHESNASSGIGQKAELPK